MSVCCCSSLYPGLNTSPWFTVSTSFRCPSDDDFGGDYEEDIGSFDIDLPDDDSDDE